MLKLPAPSTANQEISSGTDQPSIVTGQCCIARTRWAVATTANTTALALVKRRFQNRGRDEQR